MQQTASELASLIHQYSDRLYGLKEEEVSIKLSPTKWSKKEILGHLIDSAANNHQRFIRVQFEHRPLIAYDQNSWVTYNHYNELTAKQLIRFWFVYNKHLIEIIKRIPEENLERECKMKDGKFVTLDFLINDYVVHLEHHLNALFD